MRTRTIVVATGGAVTGEATVRWAARDADCPVLRDRPLTSVAGGES